MKKALIFLITLLVICLFTAFVSAVICGTEVITEVIKLINGYVSAATVMV